MKLQIEDDPGRSTLTPVPESDEYLLLGCANGLEWCSTPEYCVVLKQQLMNLGYLAQELLYNVWSLAPNCSLNFNHVCPYLWWAFDTDDTDVDALDKPIATLVDDVRYEPPEGDANWAYSSEIPEYMDEARFEDGPIHVSSYANILAFRFKILTKHTDEAIVFPWYINLEPGDLIYTNYNDIGR